LVIERSTDAQYIRFMAIAGRLAEFLKPHGEACFKQVEDWMEQRICELSTTSGNQVMYVMYLSRAQHMSLLYLLQQSDILLTSC
jgi:hypothetical protein